MPLEMDVWGTIGHMTVFFTMYCMIRCFGIFLEMAEGRLFKRSRNWFLATATIIEGFILYVAFTTINAGLASSEYGFVHVIALLHMIPLALVASAIAATLKKKYPDGLYEHLWFKYISGRPDLPS